MCWPDTLLLEHYKVSDIGLKVVTSFRVLMRILENGDLHVPLSEVIVTCGMLNHANHTYNSVLP